MCIQLGGYKVLIPRLFDSREEWLNGRGVTIGGSDASSIVGMNPYKNNVELWEEKTGRSTPEDISDKPYVKYGIEAEALLRDLFKLDFPQYKVMYEENNMFNNPKYPLAHYSADGWLIDESGRMGLLEIKTSNILQSQQKEKWKDQIPDNYYIQILHGLMVTEATFAILKAQLKLVFQNGEVYLQTKHYYIDAMDPAVKNDIEYLKNAEMKFFENLKNDERPALILPTL